MKTTAIPLVALILALGLNACGQQKITRLESDEVVDLQGEWNDTDSRLVAEEMIQDSLTFPWANDFLAEEGRKPVVRLSPQEVRIKTNGDVIAKNIFLNDIRRAFIKSGKAKVVSTNPEAGVTRGDMALNNEYAREETRKEERAETMADFILHGEINVQDQVDDDQQLKFYSVDLLLTNIETREQVWAGNKKLKKLVQNPSVR